MPQLPPRKRVAASVAAVAAAAAVTPALLVASAHAASGAAPSFAGMTNYVPGLPTPVALSDLADSASDSVSWAVDNAGCSLVNQPTPFAKTAVGEVFVSCATSVTGTVKVTATVTDTAAGAADSGTYQASLAAPAAGSVPTTLSADVPSTACAGVSTPVTAQLVATVNGETVPVDGQKVTFTAKQGTASKNVTATTGTLLGDADGVATATIATPASSETVSAAFAKAGAFQASTADGGSLAPDAGGYFGACIPFVPSADLGITAESDQKDAVSGDLTAGVPYLISGMAYRPTATSGYDQKPADAAFKTDWAGYAGLKVTVTDAVTSGTKTTTSTLASGTVTPSGAFSILYKPTKAVAAGKLSLTIPASSVTGPAITEPLGTFDVKAASSTTVTASVASAAGVLTEGVPAIVSGTVAAGSTTVPGVPVVAKLGTAVLGSGVTDASGHYAITVAPKAAVSTAAAIVVTSSATGGLASGSGSTDKVTVAPVSLGLSSAAAKSTQTVTAGTTFKLADTVVKGGTALGKAVVELTDAKGAVKAKTTAGADGTFTLSYAVPAGTAAGTDFYVVLPANGTAAVAAPASSTVAGSYLTVTVQAAASAAPSASASADPTAGASDSASADPSASDSGSADASDSTSADPSASDSAS